MVEAVNCGDHNQTRWGHIHNVIRRLYSQSEVQLRWFQGPSQVQDYNQSNVIFLSRLLRMEGFWTLSQTNPKILFLETKINNWENGRWYQSWVNEKKDQLGVVFSRGEPFCVYSYILLRMFNAVLYVIVSLAWHHELLWLLVSFKNLLLCFIWHWLLQIQIPAEYLFQFKQGLIPQFGGEGEEESLKGSASAKLAKPNTLQYLPEMTFA